MIDHNQTYHGDYFEMYRNIEPLCCVTGTNAVLQVNYNSKTKSENETRFVIIRDGEEELNEGSQHVQTSYYKINKFQGCNV